MDQKGQISPDGRWFWDGQRWLTTSSPDGAWNWNGQGWLPPRPAAGLSGRWSDFGFIRKLPGFRTGTRWKVAAASVAYLGAGWLSGLAILAVIGASAGLGPPPSHTTASPVAQLVEASPTPAARNTPPSASPVASAQHTRSPSPLPSPSPSTQPPPLPPPNTCGAPSNPWGSNFCGGRLIRSPPSDFCSYFNCISSFLKSTLGYVDECNAGTYTHSSDPQS